MSISQFVQSDSAADTVAANLPRVTWRLMPTLLGVGVGGALLAFLLLWFVGVGAIFVMLYGVLVAGPTIAVVVNAIERELGDRPPSSSRLPKWWQVRRTVAVLAWPSAFAGVGLGTLAAWDSAGGILLLVSAAIAAIALCVASVGAVVAAPLAATRGEAALSSIWRVSLYAVTKAPLAPLGAVVFAGVALTVVFRYPTSVSLLVPPVAAIVADLASRTCASHAGVVYIRCAPVSTGASFMTRLDGQWRPTT